MAAYEWHLLFGWPNRGSPSRRLCPEAWVKKAAAQTAPLQQEEIAVARCAVRGVLDFKDPGLLRRQLVRGHLSRLGLLG